ncbi:MAG TPA: ATP-grasp domain-containing protein [Herbaspirillum sp.]|jgi:biotin carboxylase
MNRKYVAFLECNASGTGVEAMERVRERGMGVILLTQEREFYKTLESDPVQAADIVLDVATSCVGAILNRLRDYPLRGIVAFDDYRIITAAAVATHLGLPAPDMEGLVNCRFKNRTRRAVRNGGVESLTFSLSAPMDARRLNYPCVIKPCDDSGSAGVRICRCAADAEAALDSLRRHRVNVRGYRLADEFQVEEFIAGDEYSAELVWSRQKAAWDLLGMTRKTVTTGEFAIEIGHDFPVRLPGHDGVAAQIQDWLRAAKITGTVAHVEFKLRAGKACLIEINPRPGGDMIHHLCRAVTGIDLVDAYLSLMIDEDGAGTQRAAPSAAAASIRFLLPPTPGSVAGIEAPPVENPNVLSCKIKQAPLRVESIASNYARLGFVIAQGADIDDAARQANAYIGQIQVIMASA